MPSRFGTGDTDFRNAESGDSLTRESPAKQMKPALSTGFTKFRLMRCLTENDGEPHFSDKFGPQMNGVRNWPQPKNSFHIVLSSIHGGEQEIALHQMVNKF
jgi:hypothetical protein